MYNNDMQKVATQTDARIYIKDNYVEMVSKDNIEYFDFDGNLPYKALIYTFEAYVWP